jgi:hypothetical protein
MPNEGGKSRTITMLMVTFNNGKITVILNVYEPDPSNAFYGKTLVFVHSNGNYKNFTEDGDLEDPTVYLPNKIQMVTASSPHSMPI